MNFIWFLHYLDARFGSRKLFSYDCRSASSFQSCPVFKSLRISKGINEFFCQSSKRFIHPLITIATIERPSHTLPGARSLVDASAQRVLMANTGQIRQCSGAVKQPRRVPLGECSLPMAEEAHPPSEIVRIALHCAVEG
jgi:hypothetical protein